MKILFLDIDGVLNSDQFFASNHEKVIEYYKKNKYDKDDIGQLLERQMLDIDYEKLLLLKNVINDFNIKVVIISTWKKLCIYPYVEKKLIELGIPIIGVTIDNGGNRGYGIKKYIEEHNITDYVILDDDIFDDYDEELLSNLIKTSFYNGGFCIEHRDKLIKKLKR